MSLFTQRDLITAAEQLLEMKPDPVPRFRLLRDVLRLDPSDPVCRQAESALQQSKWVNGLREAQLPDGTWGRFHTRDSRLRSPFPTTEIAITLALAYGLDLQSPILDRAAGKILEYVKGRSTWPDPAEKHDNPLAWGVWVRHFSAAVLAQMDKHHPALDEFWHLWAEVVTASFHSGSYDRDVEIKALNRLTNCRMKDPVPFSRKYPLLILSATGNRLPEALEKNVLGTLLRAPEGIYYVCPGPLNALPPISSRTFWSWMQGHALLSRFPLWKTMCAETANWIWSQRTENGFWDLGGTISRKPFTRFPLSESWKRPENRLIDSSVEILDLLEHCFDRD